MAGESLKDKLKPATDDLAPFKILRWGAAASAP